MTAGVGDNQRPLIIIRRVKKAGHGGHHGGAWKVAYADFVTAMMAFFMLLWLISSPDKERLKGLAEYFTPSSPTTPATTTMVGAPGGTPGQGSRARQAQADSAAKGRPSDQTTAGAARGGAAMVPDAAMRVLAQELRLALDASPDTQDAPPSVGVESTREGLRVNLMDDARRSMFRGSTAELNDYARELIGAVARRIARSGVQVAIEGHTDGTGGQDDANWRLSGNRAQAARAAMLDAGLTPDRIAEVIAKAGTQPVYPDQPTRPENRRVTIILIAQGSALPRDASFAF